MRSRKTEVNNVRLVGERKLDSLAYGETVAQRTKRILSILPTGAKRHYGCARCNPDDADPVVCFGHNDARDRGAVQLSHVSSPVHEVLSL